MFQKFYSPGILSVASSLVGEDSLSHHVDPAIGKGVEGSLCVLCGGGEGGEWVYGGSLVEEDSLSQHVGRRGELRQSRIFTM